MHRRTLQLVLASVYLHVPVIRAIDVWCLNEASSRYVVTAYCSYNHSRRTQWSSGYKVSQEGRFLGRFSRVPVIAYYVSHVGSDGETKGPFTARPDAHDIDYLVLRVWGPGEHGWFYLRRSPRSWLK